MKSTLLLQRTGRLLALATGLIALTTAGVLAFSSMAQAHAVALADSPPVVFQSSTAR